ncbi:MAG: carbamate kinase [Firmicutes bacterium]|nr:carbamate kinase [Bacillota bacterium]
MELEHKEPAKRPSCRDRQETIVVALGGNAILQPGQRGTFEEQMENVRKTAVQLAQLILSGKRLVITHGNGPQVGRIFQQQEIGAREGIPEMPLHVCGAMSQGQIGYMIQQALHNELLKAGCPKTVVTLICQSLVDPSSPAFADPTKPIGSFYSEAEAKKAMAEKGEVWKEDSGRGWRRVVPSPEPLACAEIEAIKALIDKDVVVIISGGGGIPVVRDSRGALSGIDAVIDKDLGAQVMARETGADVLLILTDVANAAIHYRTPGEKILERVSLKEMKTYYRQGHFKAGSMGPKVLAAIRFVEGGGKMAVITSLENALPGAEGRVGTVVVP